MSKNRNTDKVYEVYEKIADWYDAHRFKGLMEKEYLDLMVQSIPPRGSVLDVGCGTGEPIAQFFIERGYHVTGIDGSVKMIDLCKKRFPKEQFLVADMRMLALNKKFDAIIAWNSFFHLSREDQRAMFAVFESHIKPGGILVFTSGPNDGEVWSNNGGQDLYHASLSSDEYTKLLFQHGFEVVKHIVEDPECGDHTVWVAKYRK